MNPDTNTYRRYTLEAGAEANIADAGTNYALIGGKFVKGGYLFYTDEACTTAATLAKTITAYDTSVDGDLWAKNGDTITKLTPCKKNANF